MSRFLPARKQPESRGDGRAEAQTALSLSIWISQSYISQTTCPITLPITVPPSSTSITPHSLGSQSWKKFHILLYQFQPAATRIPIMPSVKYIKPRSLELNNLDNLDILLKCQQFTAAMILSKQPL